MEVVLGSIKAIGGVMVFQVDGMEACQSYQSNSARCAFVDKDGGRPLVRCHSCRLRGDLLGVGRSKSSFKQFEAFSER